MKSALPSALLRTSMSKTPCKREERQGRIQSCVCGCCRETFKVNLHTYWLLQYNLFILSQLHPLFHWHIVSPSPVMEKSVYGCLLWTYNLFTTTFQGVYSDSAKTVEFYVWCLYSVFASCVLITKETIWVCLYIFWGLPPPLFREGVAVQRV